MILLNHLTKYVVLAWFALLPLATSASPAAHYIPDEHGRELVPGGFVVITEDRKPSAHFEHTVLITEGDPEILTPRPRSY